MEEKDKTVAKLEAEKYYLGTRIFELTGVEEGFWSDEILVRFFSFLFYRLPLPDIINLSCHNNWNPIIRKKNEKVKRCHLCGGLDRHVLKRRRRTCLYVVFFPSVIKVGCARVLVTTNSTRRPDTCHTVGSADGLTSSESR